MPVDPLEEARERLERLMTKAVVAGGHPADDEDQSNDAHLGREFIRSRADLRTILAELDRRSPPTGEGVAGPLKDWCARTFEDTKRAKAELGSPNCQVIQTEEDRARLTAYRYGYQVGMAEAAKDVSAIIARALAAAPPPPDVSRGLDREEVAPIIHRLVLDCSEAEAYAAADAIIALSAQPQETHDLGAANTLQGAQGAPAGSAPADTGRGE